MDEDVFNAAKMVLTIGSVSLSHEITDEIELG
jgi:hypothetical protein